MAICKICNNVIDKKTEDYQNEAFRIPFINLKIWRFNYKHGKCVGFKKFKTSENAPNQNQEEKE